MKGMQQISMSPCYSIALVVTPLINDTFHRHRLCIFSFTSR